MQFKDIKIGLPIYLLDRLGVTIKTGKVVGVVPRMNTQLGKPNEMVVDVTIECDGNSITYTFKDSSNIGYTQTYAISPDKDAIIAEIESMKQLSEQAVSQHDFHVERVAKCSEALEQFNPLLKEKRENDERLSKLESSMAKMEGMLTKLCNQFNS